MTKRDLVRKAAMTAEKREPGMQGQHAFLAGESPEELLDDLKGYLRSKERSDSPPRS
jgi:hypothetical protein